ncbi:uncharacterized protein LOC135683713 [Rhopilema esculentum]|uniref:uncharacterized protein LOC135683713 n=1 Tax=Rhopilema esculentum TaxID=499914 RepID=UPI0031DBDAF0|eukprot:gene5294-456_t
MEYYKVMKTLIDEKALKAGRYIDVWSNFDIFLERAILRIGSHPVEMTKIEFLKWTQKTAQSKYDKVLESYTSAYLGWQCYRADRFDEAIKWFQWVILLQSVKKFPIISLIAESNLGIGYAYFKLKQYGNAISYLKNSLEQSLEVFYKVERAFVAMVYLGGCYSETERFDEAITYLHKALGYFESLNCDWKYTISSRLGKIYAKKGEYEEAVDYFEEALRHGSEKERADIFLCLSKATLDLGLLEKALTHVNNAIEIGKTLDDHALVIDAEILKDEIEKITKNEVKKVNEEKNEEGKEEEEKLPRHIIEGFACLICLETAEEAVETSCCHSIYCEKCLSAVKGTCPQCRKQFTVDIAHAVRRLIGNLPTQCSFDGCTAKVTRSERKDHEKRCEHRLYKCPVPECLFEGLKKMYLTHLISEHEKVVIKQVSFIAKNEETNQETDDRIQRKTNEDGKESRLGSTGKHYCGYVFGSSRCDCCDIYCGPENGCNCAACMKLDIKSFKLTKGWYVNRDGCVCQQNTESGNVYCGRLAITPSEDSDGFCGPDVGSNCDACRILQNQLRDRYAHIWE